MFRRVSQKPEKSRSKRKKERISLNLTVINSFAGPLLSPSHGKGVQEEKLNQPKGVNLRQIM